MYELIQEAQDDPILGLVKSFQDDPRSEKVALSVGVYQDETGTIPKIECIQYLIKNQQVYTCANTYLPIEGSANFCNGIKKLLLSNQLLKQYQEEIVTIQTLGASGALKIGSDFLKQLIPHSTVWLSNPSWENHKAIFMGSGFLVDYYPYYNQNTGKIDFDAMCSKITSIPRHSIILLQVCCHNPTGLDLTQEQWKLIIKLLKKHELLPFLDFAYQGFGSTLEEDAWPIQELLIQNVPFLLAQSFSKNMSMYAERVGSLSVYDPQKQYTRAIQSQLKASVRRNYSSPPRFGAKLVEQVLHNHVLLTQWNKELTMMRMRLIQTRKQLFDALQEKNQSSTHIKQYKKDWSFLLEQRGLFSYTGFSIEQVQKLRNDYAVYIVENGRMCIAGINPSNFTHVVNSLYAITQI